MDVLRTPEERDDAQKRQEGNVTAGRHVDSETGRVYESVKEYTVTEIEQMSLSQEQAQRFYDEEKASNNPRTSLLTYLERLLEEDSA